MEHKIFQKIEQSSKPDFSNIISKSFDLYKKVISEGIVHTLISLAVTIPFILIVYVPLIPGYIDMIENAGDPYYQPQFLEGMAPIMIVVWAILVFAMSFLMQVFNISIFGHFLKVLKNKDLGTNDDTGGYMTIAKEHFGKIIVMSLATTGITLLAALACYLPIFYVLVPLTLINPIFVFNPELSVGDMVKASFKLGNKYWGVLFGLILVSSLMASVGLIACYIGIIATAFFSYVVSYFIYKDTIGFDEMPTTSETLLK